MNGAYKKECFVALIAFALVTLMTHIFPMYFLFPELTESTIFGFPTHYFLTMVIGWLLLIPVYWVYIKISERIDEEIAESVVEFDTAEADAPSGQPASQPEGGAE